MPNGVLWRISVRKIAILLLVVFFLCLSVFPWLLSSCNPRSLVPDDLIQAPTLYDATVVAAQNATVDAMRNATSAYKIATIGLIETSEDEAGGSPLATSVPSTLLIITSVIDSIPSAETNTISTPIYTLTLTPEVSNNGFLPPTPIGLVDIEDLITAEALNRQLKADAEGSKLTELTVSLSPNGIHADGVIALFPGVQQPVVADGTFEVEDYSLTVKILSITIGDVDVTQKYYEQLKSRVETSLYRLLPGRYVQNFQMSDGAVTVYSKIRP